MSMSKNRYLKRYKRADSDTTLNGTGEVKSYFTGKRTNGIDAY
jgi:hypothetical protein